MASSHLSDERVLDERLARFRALRRELEVAVLPLATSIDGRRFLLPGLAARALAATSSSNTTAPTASCRC